MALIVVASPGLDMTGAVHRAQVPDLLAGEALFKGAIVYVASDNTVMLANGTAANAAAKAKGIVARDVAVGEPVTFFGAGTRMKYASGMTPGATLYVGATAGRLDTAATTGDATGVAYVVTPTDIVFAQAKL